MRDVPEVPMPVVEWLEETHPVACIGVTETPEAAHRRAGFQECVSLLRYWADLQRRTDLSPEEIAMLDEDD